MFFIETIGALLLFAVFAFGTGAALGPRSVAEPVARLAAGTAFGLGLTFLVGFGGFVFGRSNAFTALLAAATIAVTIAVRWRPAREVLANSSVHEVLVAWLLFAGWALGLLALVVTYSGGSWAVDWVEHWQRTVFFLNREPLSTRFANLYPLTARPPLANLLTALWLEGTDRTFAQYQLFMTLFGTLVLLPLWILVTRWNATAVARRWLLLVLMATPMVAQNLTFTWTKLPTAFFVLLGVFFMLPAGTERHPRFSVVGALCLGLALLTHYSAAPWILCGILAAAGASYRRWRDGAFWRRGVCFAAITAAPVMLWLGWSMRHYGWKRTLTANSTTAAWTTQTGLERLTVPARNIFDSLIPFPLRGEPDPFTLAQASGLGWMRDIAFNVYQVTLPLGIGLAGLWVLSRLAARQRQNADTPAPASSARTFFRILVPTVVILGVAVHTPRDAWGLAHICLQPLLLLGVAKVVATLPLLPRSAQVVWAGLALVDFGLGVVLHFGIESWAFAPFIAPHESGWAYIRMLGRSAAANANDKWTFGFDYFSDHLGAPPLPCGLWLALLAALVIVRIKSTPAVRPAL